MKRYKLNKKKFAWFITSTLCTIFLIYFIICWFDIAAHNISGGSDAEWNLLLKLIESVGGN